MRSQFTERESWHVGAAFAIGFGILSLLAILGV